jgi:hypothetical protein
MGNHLGKRGPLDERQRGRVSTVRHPLMDDCLDVVCASGSCPQVAVARAQMPRSTSAPRLRRGEATRCPLTRNAADESQLTNGPPVSTIIFFLDDIVTISRRAIAAMCAEVPRRRRVTWSLRIFCAPKTQINLH